MPPRGQKSTKNSATAVEGGGVQGRGQKGKRKSTVAVSKAVEAVGGKDEDELSSEVEDEELTGSTADDDAQAAIISINLMDIVNPMKPLNFGRWNDREMKESQALILHASMKASSFSTTKFENMIPLIMNIASLDESCINTDIKGIKLAPRLVLSEKGNELREIFAAGGRHRRQAARIEARALTDKINIMRKSMQDDGDGSSATEEKIRELENQRRAAIYSRDVVEVMVRNGGLLALHISRNTTVQQYHETDEEKLVMLIRGYVARSPEGPDSQPMWVARMGNKSSALRQIFHHKETLQYLLSLHEFGHIFHYKKCLNSKWIKANMHSIGGGVSNGNPVGGWTSDEINLYMQILMMMVEYLIGIWRTLVTHLDFFEMDDTSTFDKYKLQVQQTTDPQAKEPLRTCTSTWGVFTTTVADSEKDKLGCLKGGDVNEDGPTAEYNINLMRSIGDYVTNMPRSGKKTIDFQKEVERKVEWVMVDHGMFHFQRPLPLLTPTMILEMGSCLKMIPNSLSEASLPILMIFHTIDTDSQFLSWIDPYAIYFSASVKNPRTAKDVASWALRTISENSNGFFTDGRRAAREVAHLVFRYFHIFLQMESDIVKYSPTHPRPTTVKDQKIPVLAKTYPEIADKVKDLINKIAASKTKKSKTSLSLLKPTRDFERYALAAYLEDMIVDEYRSLLLEKSSSAAFLRGELKRILTKFSKVQDRVDSSGSLTKTNEYFFPDGITHVQTALPTFTTEAASDNQQRARDRELSMTGLASFLKKFATKPWLVARPGSDEVRNDIYQATKTLERLCYQNIERLNKMSCEPDPLAIDPMDPKWDSITHDDVPSSFHATPWTQRSDAATELSKYLDKHDTPPPATFSRRPTPDVPPERSPSNVACQKSTAPHLELADNPDTNQEGAHITDDHHSLKQVVDPFIDNEGESGINNDDPFIENDGESGINNDGISNIENDDDSNKGHSSSIFHNDIDPSDNPVADEVNPQSSSSLDELYSPPPPTIHPPSQPQSDGTPAQPIDEDHDVDMPHGSEDDAPFPTPGPSKASLKRPTPHGGRSPGPFPTFPSVPHLPSPEHPNRYQSPSGIVLESAGVRDRAPPFKRALRNRKRM
ncbi:hypothetical protein BD779DRAFT_1679979 [Infundibulicybe gibba]|nr:hypothetical protein BD779DRAFT_1679979 [Infundibulicybe gibba]